MMNFTLMTTLLWTFNWISVSFSEFHTVEVQPGEEVTLQCSNFSSLPSHIFWFKLDNRPNVSCVSSMLSCDANVSFCDGFQNGKFNMTSNTTTLFLKIKQVNSSDSGLYFCGFNTDKKPVVVSATYLKVQEVFEGAMEVMNMILGALIIALFIVIIGLTLKIWKLQTAHKEEQNPQHGKNMGSDDLNYAALSFHPKAKGSRRPPSDQLEPHVVYAATR